MLKRLRSRLGAGGTEITVVDPRAPQEGRMVMTFGEDPITLRSWTITTKTGARTRVDLQSLEPAPSLDRSLFNIELATANYR